jgi:hypothetical protein
MYSYDNKIHVIENFINKDTANFLVKTINPETIEIPNQIGIWGGPSKAKDLFKIGPGNPFTWGDDTSNQNWNISMDILTMLISLMNKTISDFYKNKYIPTNFFYSKMCKDGKNTLHMDNLYLRNDDSKLIRKINNKNDRSGLLYLNSEYEGGLLNFPKQNIQLKPEPGTFIFFEGNENLPHEVTRVLSGERHNIISFYCPESNIGYHQDRLSIKNEKQMVLEEINEYIIEE